MARGASTHASPSESAHVHHAKNEALLHPLVRWDQSVSSWLYGKVKHLEHRGSRKFFKVLEYSGHGVPWLLFAFYMLVWHPSHATFGVHLLLALVLDLIFVGIIKVLVRRPRPHYNKDDMRFSVAIDSFSFPSGHSSRCFTVMPLILALTDSPFEVFIFCWAFVVALSRILMGRHYFFDVVSGSLLGGLQYALVCWLIKVSELECHHWANFASLHFWSLLPLPIAAE